jgi:hypothetical protein
MAAQTDLALQDMSFVHGDGERLAFSRDGRVLYERLERRDELLRWTATLDAGEAGELVSSANRLARLRPEVPARPGVGDEVSVKISYRDAAGQLIDVVLWEHDLAKLTPGNPLAELRAVVKRVGAALSATGRGEPHKPEDAGRNWPHVLDQVKRARVG